MKTRITIVSLLLALLFTACSGKGVYGKVTDEDAGGPVAGASVELDCTDCDSDFSAQTDADGNYSFPDAPAGNYLLTVVWDNPPECPGITPYETLGSSGDFVVTFAGYGGLGGFGNKRIIAVAEFQLEEGQGKKINLEIACP
ncbi:MAG: hypothetical protein DPW18_19755 [Chloroflexi bacterium]|nr:hypothetical protein [Chloroflexota bacterium]MDL1945017.1 carboxypeptidase regulatory-like domain-containing protein [Chloroflexi bacterium CFX2]